MFPWNNVPKGSDDLFRTVAKVFFFVVVFGGVATGVWYLWVQLSKWLDEPTKAENTEKTMGTWLSSAGDLLLTWLPVLILLAIIGGVVYFVGIYFSKSHYRNVARNTVKYLRILPSTDVRLELDKIAELTRTFGGMARLWQVRLKMGQPWFRLRFAIPPDRNEIGIYLAYPIDKENSVKDTLRSVFPSAEIHDIASEDFPHPEKGGSGGHFTFQLGGRKGLPLVSLQEKKQSQLASILNCLRPGTYLDLQFSPVSWKELEERSEDVLDSLKNKKMKDMDPEEKARRVSLTQRLTGRELTFHVRLSLWSNHPQAISVVRSTAESIETAVNYDGAIRFWKHDFWNPLADRNLVPIPFPFTIMTWTCDEIANLFHLPPGDHWIYQEPDKDAGVDTRGYIVHLEANQRSLAYGDLSEGVLIGKIKHPLENREVRISTDQLSKHFLLTGASGMGKSSLAIDMIQSFLDEWFQNPDEHPGFTIVDPAREIIPIIENRLRTAEQYGISFPKEKIHHFNLSDDSTSVPALNLLHKRQGYTTNHLANQVATILVTQDESDESLLRTRRLMSLAVQSLLEDQETHTILGVDDLFRSPDFREKVVQHIQDPYVKRYWANVDEQELKNEMEPVLQRVDRILQNPTLRRLFCQKEMTLDIRKYMDEGHIVLIDTNGMKGYDIRAVVGHLINQYHQAAKRRPSGAKFHLMMVDEAQLVQLPLLTEILSEDRKYAFGLGLITREIDQFKDEDLVHAIRSNIGMIISCGQTEGSTHVEHLTRQTLSAKFVERLPERNAALYIRSKRNQRSSVTTCVVENEPPLVYLPDGKEANHLTNERDQAMEWGSAWGLALMQESTEVRPISEVDREIAEYMNPIQTDSQDS
ncbi:hypothetical protein [Hazenella coriacea]|uniref:Uncharacterized protein n=1 Tax=Hazenella coriacea TaxID=1179467 RepID=A0A4R3LF08_9BACL|nr:hypothetical protein [Hazenella coriacea]TCS96954.1 hypothetical protein EDD58_101601 [Hazenella coriacea]